MISKLPCSPGRRTRSLLAFAFALALAGCAGVSKVGSGETIVRNRLAVTVEAPWNQFERGLSDSTPTWTVEGITVDALQFYVGIKDGEVIAAAPGGAKSAVPLAFRKGMQPPEIVALFQGLWTRDGSSFTLDKLEPADFVGTRGFHLEYSLTRKVDDVRLRGTAWGAVRDGELFVIVYSAPRLGFYERHLGRAEALARSARIKG